MPWHQEAMKDVGACDKPRRAGKRAMTRGFPNGETQSGSCRTTVKEPTRGTEPSQYPEERKSTETPLVAASERGHSPNPSSASLQALLEGGCRAVLLLLQEWRGVTNRQRSGSTWEGVA